MTSSLFKFKFKTPFKMPCSICSTAGHNKTTCCYRMTPQLFDSLPEAKRSLFLELHAVSSDVFIYYYNQQVDVPPTPPAVKSTISVRTRVEVCACCLFANCVCEMCDDCGKACPGRHRRNQVKMLDGQFKTLCNACFLPEHDKRWAEGWRLKPCAEREGWSEYHKE